MKREIDFSIQVSNTKHKTLLFSILRFLLTFDESNSYATVYMLLEFVK